MQYFDAHLKGKLDDQMYARALKMFEKFGKRFSICLTAVLLFTLTIEKTGEVLIVLEENCENPSTEVFNKIYSDIIWSSIS